MGVQSKIKKKNLKHDFIFIFKDDYSYIQSHSSSCYEMSNSLLTSNTSSVSLWESAYHIVQMRD